MKTWGIEIQASSSEGDFQQIERFMELAENYFSEIGFETFILVKMEEE